MRVLVLPASGRPSRHRFENTITRPVPLGQLRRFLTSEQVQALEQLNGGEPVPTWGLSPGTNNSNIPTWNQLQVGDIALFTGGGLVFASGSVAYKAKNSRLALNLWGRNDNGQTWENLCFLRKIHRHAISYADFNQAAGYNPRFVPQGAILLNEQRSAGVLSAFGLEPSVDAGPISEDQYRAVVLETPFDPEEPLDLQGKIRIRKEQSFLRGRLFQGRPLAVCEICGRRLPTDLLVAAHIKRRSECSTQERLDWRHVVMPMCKLGCDDLFERGYIAVDNGMVIVSHSGPLSSDLAQLMTSLAGRHVTAWSPRTEGYFAWHREHRFTGNRSQ